MELTGISTDFPLDGQSLLPLMKNGSDAQRAAMAFSYFRNGISMRTDRYRLTRYFREAAPTLELFDHQNDPMETVNIAGEFPEIVAELLPQLEKGNTGLYANRGN
jgi:arylsulfatase A-like enzyme